MAHKVWDEKEERWVEAHPDRVAKLQEQMVTPGVTVPLPPVKASESMPLPEGVEPGDTLWMKFNDSLHLDRARA